MAELSIVIPAHNEEENIPEVIRKIEDSLEIPHELIVVNDHSKDATYAVVERLSQVHRNIRLVENKLAKGFANAIKTGFEHTRTEVVVPVMADLCDDLSTIRIMLGKIKGGYDIVCAARYIKGGRRIGGSKVKGFFSYFVGRTMHYLVGIPTHDIANAFKMYRKKVVQSMEIQARGFEISMEIPLKAYFLGFKITEVPTLWKERTKGRSSFRMLKLFPNYFKIYIWAIFKNLLRKRCHYCQ